MASAIPDKLAPFLSVKSTVILPIFTFSTMYFTYGFYALLFGTYLLMIRKREPGHDGTTRLYLGQTIALFVLSTMFVVIVTIYYVGDSTMFFDTVKSGDYGTLAKYLEMGGNKKRIVLGVLESLIPVLLNVTAEWMLIHRCCTMWSFDKRIGVPLILASLAINAIGLTSAILMAGISRDSQKLYNQGTTLTIAYSISSVAINSALTVLTAGRVWWTHRQIRACNVHTSDRLASSVCRIILESGIIYPLFQIAGLIEANTGHLAPLDLWPLIALSAGIAPTLIMVRAKLSTNDGSSPVPTGNVSDLQFGSRVVVQSHNIAFTEIALEDREPEDKGHCNNTHTQSRQSSTRSFFTPRI